MDYATRLLLTDVTLPGDLNGRQLADEAVRRPDLKILLYSGYTLNPFVHCGRLNVGRRRAAEQALQLCRLAEKVREVLG